MLVGQEWSGVWQSQPSAPCLDRESISNKREWGINTRPVHTATLALLKTKRYFPQRAVIPWITVVTKTRCVNMAKMSSYWGFKIWFTTTYFSSSQPDPRSARDAAQRCELTESTRHVLFLETQSWFIVLQGENGSAAKRAGFRSSSCEQSEARGCEQSLMTQEGAQSTGPELPPVPLADLTEPGEPQPHSGMPTEKGWRQCCVRNLPPATPTQPSPEQQQKIKYCPVIIRRKQNYHIVTHAKPELLME